MRGKIRSSRKNRPIISRGGFKIRVHVLSARFAENYFTNGIRAMNRARLTARATFF